MSLYDDDIVTDKSAAGWASGIKFMQNQLAFKKATITAPKRDMYRKRTDKLPPVIDLKSRKDDEENTPPYFMQLYGEPSKSMSSESFEMEWKFANEYDPHWPNEYEKVVKETKERKKREDDEKRRQEREERKKRDNSARDDSFTRPRTPPEEEEEEERPRRTMGAAIAPPPMLDDSPPHIIMPQKAQTAFGGGSVAAKIMAKYGFKEGQGLGKSQQGIVKALEVEKTSKRGGRIVAEDGGSISPPPPPPLFSFNAMPPPPVPVATKLPDKPDNISSLLKNPSKVAILLNMVGPGEVDDDLEPEVSDECSSKYGPVTKVVIFEIPMAPSEEAVRIYVEFQRVESAIKAVIDLNGRFFGGRLVRAGFYDYDNFKAFKLNEELSL